MFYLRNNIVVNYFIHIQATETLPKTMITIQVIEEYVKSQPLVTRQLFSAILASKNPVTKHFLVKSMRAIRESLQEVKDSIGMDDVNFEDSHWFSLVAERLSLEQLMTVFQANSDSKKQKLKSRIFNLYGFVLLPIINSVTALNALKVKDNTEEQNQMMNAVHLAIIYNKLLPIKPNSFKQAELETKEISLFVDKEIAEAALKRVFQSFVDEEVDIIYDIFLSLGREVKGFGQATKCSSFEAALLDTIQICTNEATVFGCEFGVKGFWGLSRYATIDDAIDVRTDFYLTKGEKTIKLINEQLTVKHFIKEYSALPCSYKDYFSALIGRSESRPSASEVWSRVIRICINYLSVASTKKGLELAENLREWSHKRYSKEQIITKLDLSDTEQKLSIMWKSVMHLSEDEWRNLNRHSNFFSLLSNFCEKIRMQIRLQACLNRQTVEIRDTLVKDVTCSSLISQVDLKFNICSRAITEHQTLGEQAVFIERALAAK